MTTPPEQMLAATLHRITGAETVCYCPCAGRDVEFALNVLGAHLGRFVFCDRGYRRQQMTGRGAVPADWRFVTRVPAVRRPATPPPERPAMSEITETWSRPDGSPVMLEFRAALAEEVLSERFAAGTISALVHINDGTGEGGSDLWFLGSHGICGADASRSLLPAVSERLTDEALVFTDGALTDPEFGRGQSFRRCGRLWEPLVPLENRRAPDRKVTVWRATRESGC